MNEIHNKNKNLRESFLVRVKEQEIMTLQYMNQ